MGVQKLLWSSLLCIAMVAVCWAEETSSSTLSKADQLRFLEENKRDMLPENFAELIPSLSQEEQYWVNDWCDDGLVRGYLSHGSPPPEINAILSQYYSVCPPSQMRYILKELYHAPSSVIFENRKAYIYRHLLGCKDQTVIDLGREIARQGIGNLSQEWLYAMGKMNDPLVDQLLEEYLQEESHPFKQREKVFRIIALGIYSRPCQKAQQQFDMLKTLACVDKKFMEIANFELISPSMWEKITIEEATLQLLHENIAYEVEKSLMRSYDQYGASLFYDYNFSPSFMVVDKFLSERGKPANDFERYVILQYLDSHRLYWFSPESVEYVSTELAKLAPKFAAKEKALAEAEAAYIAQYPDRAPVPIGGSL